MIKKLIYILIVFQFLLSNEISIPILEIEGEYEKRYSTALKSVLGPESFYIEVNAKIDQSKSKKNTSELPINFLPGLGIKTQSIPNEIQSKNKNPNELIKSLDVILTFENSLSDSIINIATTTIKNHILYKKIQNNLIINRTQLYKSPEVQSVDVVYPVNTFETEDNQKSIFKNKSVISSILIGFIIVICVITIIFFINKLYKKFITFSQSQLEGQDAVRLALEEGLSKSELLQDDDLLIKEKTQTSEKIDEPISKPEESINQNIQSNNQNNSVDANLESTFREVGAEIIDAISNIAEPVTSSVKEAISESTALELKQQNPFEFIQFLDSNLNKQIFMSENEASSAIVLSHIDPKKASEILLSLDVDIRLKISQHMATMEGTSKEILNSIKTKFRNKVKELLKPDFTPINGANVLSNILNEMNQEDSENILFSISQTNKTISTNIRKNIGYFNDILTLDNNQIDQLINNVDINTLANSLVNSEESIQDKIFNSLSNSGQFALKRRIQLLESVDPKTIQIARKKIGDNLINLMDSNNENV